MEIKKSPKADLEKGKGLNFLLGLVVALAIVYVALEYRTYDKIEAYTRDKVDIADMEETILLEENEPEPEQPEPEQPQQQEVQLPEEFKVVDNTQKVEKIALVSVDESKPLPPPTQVAPVKVEEEEDKIHEVVESPAEFPGGYAALSKWLSKNLVYPEQAAEMGVQGKVIVRFVVEKDGSVTQATVLKGIDPALDKEALGVIQAMPKWKPGMQQGRAVRVRCTQPVQFKLQ